MEKIDMRVLVAAALITIGLTGVSAANLPSTQPDSYFARYYAFGRHAAPLVV